jgi:hypothetical protein
MHPTRRWQALLLTVISTLISGEQFQAQAPPPKCPPEEVHRFDFLIGDWRGVEYNVTHRAGDSTFEATVVAHNSKLPYGCAFEEHWEFVDSPTLTVRTAVLRAFDLASHSWKYSLVNNFVELVTFDSQLGDSGWVFVHDIAGVAPPTRLRIQWVPTSLGYTEVIQVSPDSGRTWPIVRHLNYRRSPRP